jgi:lytic murein transglycosylase B
MSRRVYVFIAIIGIFAGCYSMSTPAQEFYHEREDVQNWINDFAGRENLNPEFLSYYLAKTQKHERILSLMDAPVKTPPGWYEYAPRFLNDGRIDAGALFWRINETYLTQAARYFSVPPEIIVSIIGIETYYGRNTGGFPVLDALATLAFDYPRRADYFRTELEQFFMLTLDNRFDQLQLKGSYAGAMGIAQFMPRSYRHFAVDFDGDGKIDLWQSADAIGSIAFYLFEHGWQHGGKILSDAVIPNEVSANILPLINSGLSETKSWQEWQTLGVTLPPFSETIANDEILAMVMLDTAENTPVYYLAHDNFRVIMRYNKSRMYATAVKQLADALVARRFRDY